MNLTILPQIRLFRTIGFLCSAILAVLLQAMQAEGAYEINLGKLQLQPYASLKETWTDNVFSTSSNEKSDRVTIVMPGVKALFPFSVHKADFEYYAVIKRHDRFTTERTNDHAASGLFDLKFGSNVTLKLGDKYQKNHEPRSSSTTGFIETYRINTGSASLSYQLAGRSKVQLDYSATAWKFATSTFRDRREELAAGSLYYRFLPKTSAFIAYDKKIVDFTEATTPLDNTMDGVHGGVTWDVTNRSKGTLKFGKTWKRFDAPGMKEYDTWASSVDVTHNFTQYTSVVITGQRSVNESNRLGTRFFTTTAAYAEFSHRFGYRFAVVAHGSYGIDGFSDIVPPETQRREDSTISGGGGFKYSLKDWLDIIVDYTYKSRDSNSDANDYREHQYSTLLSIVL